MKIRLRRTRESDLDFVMGAEQAAETSAFVGSWTREQHRSACSSEDFAHFILRVATPEDAEAIAAALAEAFAEHESAYMPQAYAATVPTVEEIKRRFGEEQIWAAVMGDKIVGTVSAVPRESSLYIRSMAILPEARGKRIGERLLKQIEDYAVARNYRKLSLNTTPFLKRAIRLYEKFGFVRCGADDLFGTPLWTMTKSLENE